VGENEKSSLCERRGRTSIYWNLTPQSADKSYGTVEKEGISGIGQKQRKLHKAERDIPASRKDTDLIAAGGRGSEGWKKKFLDIDQRPIVMGSEK